MKRIVLAFLLVLVVLAFSAQTVVYVNLAVVTWNPVTTLADGSPVPASEISYEIVIGRPADKVNFTILGEVASPPFTVSLPQQGDWLVGVRAVRAIGAERLRSSFLWSDGTTNPFLLRYYLGPAAPTDLRLQ